MALPAVAVVLAFIARVGGPYAIKQAIKKFGKEAVLKATDKMTYLGKGAMQKSKTLKDTKIAKETEKIREKLNLPKESKGGTIKTYAKGSVIRKPRSY